MVRLLYALLHAKHGSSPTRRRSAHSARSAPIPRLFPPAARPARRFAWTTQPHSSDERMLICDAVSDGRMPLPEYTLFHRNARLSKQDVTLICNWAATPSTPLTLSRDKSTNKEKAAGDGLTF
jgi:hypothetical protein